ncbi:hypothetical protein [Sphingobium sp. EM0848]|uniref:hypothetical protein n=1 Tax=Sphingobium sp. EM0848 TaxID=2743473 RepID=UPI00159C0E3A|nr:hypothetical protein [Sphingobium sp. EM0848]
MARHTLLGDPDAGRINAYVLRSLRFECQFYLLMLPVCVAAMGVARTRRRSCPPSCPPGWC